ncbi:MAG: hypothetical protein IPL79_17490 [Myxococcales bacterium]|nr:hypothetical protein [Myxococcales bacterium]
MKLSSLKHVSLVTMVGLLGGAGGCFDGPSPGESDAQDGDKSAAPHIRKLAILHADRMGENISPEPRFMLQVLSQQELDEDHSLVYERCPTGSAVNWIIGYCEVQVDDASGALQRMVEATMASITSDSTELRALVIGEPRLIEVDGDQKLALDSSHEIYLGQVPRQIAHMNPQKASPTLYRATQQKAFTIAPSGFGMSVERAATSVRALAFAELMASRVEQGWSSEITPAHLADAYTLQARNAQYLSDELNVTGVFFEAANPEDLPPILPPPPGQAPGIYGEREEGELFVLDVYRKVVAAE